MMFFRNQSIFLGRHGESDSSKDFPFLSLCLIFFGFSDEFIEKSDTVMLEPNPTNYSRTTTYVQMYSGNPYVLGLDPV